MDFPYKQVFKKAEETLLLYGSEHKPMEEIRERWNRVKAGAHKTFGSQRLSDDEFYSTMVKVVFFAGFRAAVVGQKLHMILHHFPNWEIVSRYTDREIACILDDPSMIRHPGKINACGNNAQQFQAVIREHGSFRRCIDSFNPEHSFENLMRLKEELQRRFDYLGEVTVYHFMMIIGLPVLKPDLVVSRIFYRLSVTNQKDNPSETVKQGLNFAKATGLPIGYIDHVFVVYGQMENKHFGIDRGICLDKPRCGVCGLTDYCGHYRTNMVAGRRRQGIPQA